MTANGAHGGGDAGPPIAGDVSTFPSDAELSRTLVAATKTASLSTLTNSGYPYGSIVSYIPDDNGDPVILVSDLAEHTINARSNNRASMLIAESADGDDPLGKSRLTLVGRLSILEDSAEARESYLQKHRHASFYVDFDDFNFWKLSVEEVRFVGGFGHMSWVTSEEYKSAEVDPLFEAAAGIIAHMNTDHNDANLLYVQNLANLQNCEDASMLGVDRYGVTLRALTQDGPRMARIGFPSPLSSPDEARPAIITLLDSAKGLEVLDK